MAAGTYIDEIIRGVLSGKPVVNDPKYRMSNELFTKFTDQVEQKRKALTRLGIKIIADEVVLRSKGNNGEFVAGVTDAIGVDEQGRVFIIDFKTTSGYKAYNKGDDSLNNIGGRLTPEEAAEINKKGEQTAEFDR
jgi:hypothetical protein